jgi:hypothetical protein
VWSIFPIIVGIIVVSISIIVGTKVSLFMLFDEYSNCFNLEA